MSGKTALTLGQRHDSTGSLLTQYKIRFPVPQTPPLINDSLALFYGYRIRDPTPLLSVTLAVTSLALSQMFVQPVTSGFISLNVLVNPLMADGAPMRLPTALICSGLHFQLSPVST